MQKHSDRPEKRSSGILASGGLAASAGSNTAGQGHGGNVVGSGATAGSQSTHGLTTTGGTDYWSNAHDRVAADYAAQSAALMDPRLNPYHRDMMVDPRHATMEDLRAAAHHNQLSAGSHALGGYVDHTVKTSSAFSPIQGSMLHTASGGFPMTGSRGAFYDHIGFQKPHGQVK